MFGATQSACRLLARNGNRWTWTQAGNKTPVLRLDGTQMTLANQVVALTCGPELDLQRFFKEESLRAQK